MRKDYKKGGHMAVISNLYNEIPTFSDVFTEESFYVFVFFFVLCTVLMVFVISRFITIKPVE